MSKFSLGKIVMTRGINDKIADNKQFAKDVTKALGRYSKCDWGEMDSTDLESNDIAVRTGEMRIFAAYQTCEGKVWIITEHDRSYTTILFPNEY